MGIHQLMQLIKEKAPNCFRKLMLDYFAGRVIGCDASLAMYQFLIQTQGVQNNVLQELTDKEGNKTGHLVGLFNRTIQFISNGIKPVWVFDGKPPAMKSGELARRKRLKQEAVEETEKALEQGDMQKALQFNQRTTHITTKMKDDAIKMLRLMGCPVIMAPSEAEAQCAALCKAGKIYATATEDLDALTFKTPVLLRGFNTKNEPIYEIIFDDMLVELDLTYEQFVDLCILCGCDYTSRIEGIGPATAYKLIKEHKSIEKIIEFMVKENESREGKGELPKYKIPKDFAFEECRKLFITPVVDSPEQFEIKWNKPDEEALKEFLCGEKGFAETRLANGLKKLAKDPNSTGHQSRLESFFGKPTKVTSSTSKQKEDKKKSTRGQKKKL